MLFLCQKTWQQLLRTFPCASILAIIFHWIQEFLHLLIKSLWPWKILWPCFVTISISIWKKKLYPVISTVEVSHKIITKRARAYDLAGNMRKSWYPVSESMSLICVEFELTHNSHTNTASSYETYAKYPLAQSVYSNNLCAVDIKA